MVLSRAERQRRRLRAKPGITNDERKRLEKLRYDNPHYPTSYASWRAPIGPSDSNANRAYIS